MNVAKYGSRPFQHSSFLWVHWIHGLGDSLTLWCSLQLRRLFVCLISRVFHMKSEIHCLQYYISIQFMVTAHSAPSIKTKSDTNPELRSRSCGWYKCAVVFYRRKCAQGNTTSDMHQFHMYHVHDVANHHSI
ncbi:hypothetical protein DPSP01_006093 [Paraphaeosphaeria sporulosa]